MKLSDKIATHAPTHPFYTFEFFPPRTDQVRCMREIILLSAEK